MKDLTRAVQLLVQFKDDGDTILGCAHKLVKSGSRKALELETVALDCYEFLQKIRYRNWPTGTGDALGMTAEEIDALIMELSRTLKANRASTRVCV